jgi:peroxiredoxin Q/BCP
MNTSLQIGQPFPQFSLPAAVPQGASIAEQTMSNDDLRGRTTVVFFYPKDATSGCTVEVCGFRDLYPEFEKSNVQVIGVSRDTVSSHKRFIQNQNLPYLLIADKERVLIEGLNLLVNKSMYGKPVTGVLRNTFVLDKEGNIARVFEKVTPLSHAQEVLDYVRSL